MFRREATAAGGQVPDNLRVEITDPDLLRACGISDGQRCPSTVGTGDDGDGAVIPVVAPLIVLLFTLLSTVAA